MMITRRSALKTLAAALMAHVINLRPEIDRESLMRPFCTKDGLRYYLDRPFQDGTLTYATDGVRMIRAELTAPEIVGEVCLPPAAKVFQENWRPLKWRRMERPEIKDLVTRDGQVYPTSCPVCGGRMISFDATRLTFVDEWESCERRGVRVDVDDATHGDESCPQCHGKYYYGPSVLALGDERLDYWLLDPIWKLPGEVLISTNRVPGQPVLFKADGFEGMVMPLAKV